MTGVSQGDGGSASYSYDALNRLTGEAETPGVPIANSGFEAPYAGPAGGNGSFAYNPSGAGWTFSSQSGVSGNGSGFTNGNPAAPNGLQVGFLQINGSISQTLSGFQAGVSYTLTVSAAQRGNTLGNGGQSFEARLDGTPLGTITPSGASYADYAIGPFTASAGSHTLSFAGTNPHGYDNTAFLDNVRITASSAGTTSSYAYDLAGNITAFDANAYGFDAADKVQPAYGFSYDGDGNATDVNLIGAPYAWQGYACTWDALGRMTSTSKPGAYSFAYDARGLRVEMQGGASVDPTFYIYDGTTLLGEVLQDPYVPTPSVSAVYTWGADGLVSGNFGGRSLWYHFGPQGETRQLTDGSGNVADAYSYTAYGVVTGASGSDANPFQYGGQFGYYTAGSPSGARILCGLRWYDPYLGRFLSRDPIGYGGGDNLYAYCGGDPVNEADPSGTNPFGDYCSQSGAFLEGELDALNPVQWFKGLYGAGSYLNQNDWSDQSFENLGSNVLNGLEFWNKNDPYQAGQSFMTDVLLASPAIKRIPNFTRFAVEGPWLTPKGGPTTGATLLKVSNDGNQVCRVDVGRLPNKATIPPLLRGRLMPHYHRAVADPSSPGESLVGQGVGRHRPWQSGPGSRL